MPILAIDTETGIKHSDGIECQLDATKFVLGTVAGKGRTNVFYDRREMLSWILAYMDKQHKWGHKTYIYGHNMSYDFNALGQEGGFETEGLEYPSLNNPFMVTYNTYNGDKRVNKGMFLDLMSIYNTSLASVARGLGMVKQHPKGFINGRVNIDELAEYCKHDSEIVLRAIVGFREGLEKVGYKPRRVISSPQVAISSFFKHIRNNGMFYAICQLGDDNFPTGKIHKTAFDREIRISYRGARNEAFKLGKMNRVTYYDVNSLYPFVMTQMRFPNLRSERLICNAKEECLTYIGVCKCKIEVPDIDIGFLPIRYKGMQLFPDKKGLVLESIWTNREIKYAMDLGYKLLEMDWIIIYESMENIFRDFMQKMYKLKQKGGAQGLAAKLLMNSLYGKFAQKSYRKERKFIYRNEIRKWLSEGWEIEGELGSKYMISRVLDNMRSYFVNPIISTLITADAREFLYEHLRKVGARNLVYCDTDSIMLLNNSKCSRLFDIGKEMGQWKIEYFNKDAHIKEEKIYKIGDKIAIGGLRRAYHSDGVFESKETKCRTMVSLGMSIRSDTLKAGEFIDKTINIRSKKKGDVEIKEKEIVDL